MLNNKLQHSVSPWCFEPMTLVELCAAAKAIGMQGIDLCGPADWPTLKQFDLYSPMCNGAEISLTEGFNDPQYHTLLFERYTAMIPLVSQNGYQNLICFSGNRRGISDDQGLQNCVAGIEPLLKLAEEHSIVLCMELLNSRVDHPDYQCDHTEWGVELAKHLDSNNFKLLYDIYHMQIMEGDIIASIKKYSPYIAHYHTAGVPGRNEINQSQELNYPAIMQAIAATGYTGFIGQEFVPLSADKIAALKAAVELCDV
ncbi:hydroxypyruvate isomerase [Mucilaginibacter yixingensis]|uniref:Hydroxypyruvate isomerase n=1 Tax=Mucilaginibacter yixingensis TaxID=1295612 RepID=A0A2T5JBK1_9SPHI|nr:TIM barrel protein [Mucilaginibacter yixingensis]PTQ98243.1 hydroxypyruvate isomerase [Mucilaginibacter yixingensis]